MRKLFLLGIAALTTALISANSVVYEADKDAIFPNPERGFTEELGGETKLSDSKNHVVKPEADWYFDLEDPDNADRKTQTLVMLMYYLYNYKSKDLSDKLLKGFDEDMQILRDHGFKCVLRFAYDWNSKNDATLDYVKKHISQLKPHLASNADVIYVLETGFVGQWGEWYYSKNFGNETQELNDKRRQVLEAMLDAVPEGRFLLVRYPLIKLSYLGDEVPLTAEEAFSGSNRAKIGHHNDAFLADWGNDGTYGRNGEGPDDDPILRSYIAAETLYVPNGGETNVEGATAAEKIYQDATTEMSEYHWSFCGSTYSEDVTNRWRKHGIFDELNRKMGYRYELVSAELPDIAAQGSTKTIEIQIRNVGYAPLYNARPVFLVLSNETDTIAIQLQSDPRRWLPNGELTTISESVTIPKDVPVGTYELYLHMPDAYASLAADPRYAVRFANVGTWDSKTGMNSLKASIAVTKADTTGLNNMSEPMEAVKTIRNGQLIILRGGQTYNAQGTKMN
jgi:hypothetical protein